MKTRIPHPSTHSVQALDQPGSTPPDDPPSDVRTARRILVADDDRAFRRVSVRALERAGFDVLAVATAQEALAAVDAGTFDVAILDHFLGDQLGCDLIAPIRARQPAIKIVILSGLGNSPELMRSGYEAGADHVASKLDVDWVAIARATWPASPPLRPTVDLYAVRRDLILGTFPVHHHNVSRTARALGFRRTTLQRLLRQMPLPAPESE